MTRVSSGISGKRLSDVHLRKERIEILRIPNTIRSGKAKVDLNKIPKDLKYYGEQKTAEELIKLLHD